MEPPRTGIGEPKFKAFSLDIPELNGVIEEWDQLVRSAVPEDGYWFAPFNTLEGGFDTEVDSIGKNRYVRVRKDLKRWLETVKLPYPSPLQHFRQAPGSRPGRRYPQGKGRRAVLAVRVVGRQQRRHSTLGYVCPEAYEATYYQSQHQLALTPCP